jgi:hypothetical protein
VAAAGHRPDLVTHRRATVGVEIGRDDPRPLAREQLDRRASDP